MKKFGLVLAIVAVLASGFAFGDSHFADPKPGGMPPLEGGTL
ncbi:hypothetical protein [Bacillus sp. T33-2]|nr:hypothetical protein [Bacillus sp. T33-2]